MYYFDEECMNVISLEEKEIPKIKCKGPFIPITPAEYYYHQILKEQEDSLRALEQAMGMTRKAIAALVEERAKNVS